ncbi:MAG TPA: Zn-ribbon domain-containing OB-fold protein [Dehalococcoidia bacterium]|nr:Zn-ribbon domain-containing OB-fold protein [Dehalococcoidia bacterium]
MTTAIPDKPLPFRTSWTQSFWDGTKRGEFLIQRCSNCDTPRFPPKPVCSNCWSTDYREVPAAGTGTVYTFTVQYRAGVPAFANDVPYAIVLVELDEGVRVMSDMVNCDAEEVHIGMPVKLVWDPPSEDLTMYKFEPA